MKRLLLSTVAVLGFFASPANADNLKFYTQDFQPFAAADASGPFKDILSEACTRLKHTCTFEALPWARAQAVAKDEGGVAGIFPLGKNAEREAWMGFSIPLIQTEYGFYVPEADAATYSSLADLKGYSVSTYGPSNSSADLEKLAPEGGFTPVIEKSMDIAMKKTAGGRYEGKNAVFGNTDVMKSLIKSQNITGLKYLGQQKPITYYVGFPKREKDQAFVDAFNAALTAMKTDGTIKTILAKYELNEAQ